VGKNSHEHSVLMEFSKPCCLSKVVVGMSGEKAQPFDAVVEVGPDPEHMAYLGTLRPIEKAGLHCYVLNLLELSGDHQQLQTRRVLPKSRFLRLVLTKSYPVSLAMLSSVLAPDAPSLTLSFVSLFGFTVGLPMPSRYPDFCCNELEVLSKQFNRGVLGRLLERGELFGEFEKAMDGMMARLMSPNFKTVISEFLLECCKRNAKLSDLIVSKILDLRFCRDMSPLLFEIIVSDKKLASARLEQLAAFIAKTLSPASFCSLAFFIEAFVNSLDFTPGSLAKLSRPDIGIVLKTYQFAYQQKMGSCLVRYITRLYDWEVIPMVWQEAWGPALIGALALTDEKSHPYLQERMPALIDVLLVLLQDEQQADRCFRVVAMLMLCNDLAQIDVLFKLMARQQWPLTILKALREGPSQVRQLNTDCYQAVVRYVASMARACKQDIAALLKDMLQECADRPSPEFMAQLLWPLLNSYCSVPVCLACFDGQTDRPLNTPSDILNTQSLDMALLGEQGRLPRDCLTYEILRAASSIKFYDQKYVRKSNLDFIHPYPVYHLPESMTFGDILATLSFAGLVLPTGHALKLRTLHGVALDSSTRLGQYKSGATVLLRLNLNELLSETGLKPAASLIEDKELDDRNLLAEFDHQGGIQQLISVLSKSIDRWKNKYMQGLWMQYIRELESFTRLPTFFAMFMRKTSNIELLASLLSVAPDSDFKSKNGK
jgi:hypothetical protein